MKRSQTAKTSNEKIMFIDESDRVKFAKIVTDLLKSDELKKLVFNREKKRKYRFSLKFHQDALSPLGISPDFTFRFKKVQGTGEWDLDMNFKKKENVVVSDYFEKVYTSM